MMMRRLAEFCKLLNGTANHHVAFALRRPRGQLSSVPLLEHSVFQVKRSDEETIEGKSGPS